ncbi:MAG: hypothetical protein F6K09_24060 [Merismopedia sp. SIO2A8]|nr:hypothetical protein [Merismopedia sp. SIO2A8]
MYRFTSGINECCGGDRSTQNWHKCDRSSNSDVHGQGDRALHPALTQMRSHSPQFNSDRPSSPKQRSHSSIPQ